MIRLSLIVLSYCQCSTSIDRSPRYHKFRGIIGNLREDWFYAFHRITKAGYIAASNQHSRKSSNWDWQSLFPLQDVIVINVRTLDRKEHLIAHSVTPWYVLPKVSMWKFIHSGNGAVHHNSIVASSTVKTTYNRTFIPGILYVINIMTRAQRSIKLMDFYVLNYLRIQWVKWANVKYVKM